MSFVLQFAWVGEVFWCCCCMGAVVSLCMLGPDWCLSLSVGWRLGCVFFVLFVVVVLG